jgi:hypothetical protein
LIPDVFPKLRTSRQLSGNIGSPVTDRAMILSTLLTVQPEHPSIPPMVEELVQLGRAGEWRSTQDVSLALLALAQYQRKFKDVKPFTTVELRRGVEQLATSADGKDVVWRAPNAATTQPALTAEVDGPPESRGYVSWVQTGVPLASPPDETSKGLTVRRRFLTPDGSEELEAGRLVSGQLVRVELTVDASRNFDCVVIEDLLPGGLEIENPRLSSSAQMDESTRHRPRRRHSTPAAVESDSPDGRDLQLTASPDIRDDRIVLFTNLRPGKAKYEYLARAVTVGAYVMPPVRAECMYDLATFSLTGAGKISVVAEKPSPVAAGVGR